MGPSPQLHGCRHPATRAYKKAVAQYTATRRAAGFIETEEREDIFGILDHIVQEAAAALGLDLAWARDSLTSGVESVRNR